MIKNLCFGQYSYRNSLMHRLDPRVKLLQTIALSSLVFFIDGAVKILAFSFLAIAVVLLSKIGVKELIKSLKPFYLIFVFILAMYVIFSKDRLLEGIASVWRFLMLIILSFALTFTTSASDLVAAVEKLAKPLKFLNIKPRNIAMMISATIRFIPVMFLNLERIKDSMLARLADFRKLRHIKIIMLALLERMLKSASNLSDAAQSRLYSENAESSKALKLGKHDYVSAAAALIFILSVY